MEIGLNGGLFETGRINIIPKWYDGGSLNTWIINGVAALPSTNTFIVSEPIGKNIHCILSSKHYCYNTTDNIWTEKAPLPTDRDRVVSAVVNNKIYCIGGRKNSTIHNANECYDPVTNTWSAKTVMPNAPGYVNANKARGIIGNKIYCIIDAYNQCYDTTTNTWTAKTSNPNLSGMTNFSAIEVGGTIYQFFGYRYSYSATWYKKVFAYDTTTDSWSTKADTKIQYTSERSGVAVCNGNIYVLGGYNNSVYANINALEKVFVYYPSSDSWAQKTSIPNSMYLRDATASTVDNRVYLIGGYDDNRSSLSAATSIYLP